ncbi:MAG: bifunctional 3,4-dihydroxy-2-butanone-4-phosphate synthase/GTP cyclohydrolase II [Planctomycetota bacterium]
MFASISELVKDLKEGKMIILVDDENRENEGDIVVSAEHVTAEIVNFVLHHARGLLCVAVSADIARRLELNPMVLENQSLYLTNFTVSIDYKDTGTGISAYDRALTIQKIVDERSRATDFKRPGHIFPIIAREGGVLIRAGHTEGAVDLMTLGGMKKAALICEILNEDGTMARLPQLLNFAQKHNLKIGSIADIIAHRMKSEKLIERIEKTALPTAFGEFTLYLYRSKIDTFLHIALTKGDIGENVEQDPIPVRVHSECTTGDVFSSLRCDCGEQLKSALKFINNYGRGVLLYLKQEGRGLGLINKIKSYALQDKGLDTVEASKRLGVPVDLREYGTGAQILVDLGIRKIILLTNNPKKIAGLCGYGLEIVKREPLLVKPNEINIKYLKTKKEKMGHLLDNV